MTLVQKALALLISSWTGCLCSLMYLEFVHALSVPKRYIVVLPLVFVTALAITDLSCALFVRRVRERSRIMLIGLIQGLASPWVGSLIWGSIHWEKHIAGSQLYISALFVCTASFAFAYFMVSGNAEDSAS